MKKKKIKSTVDLNFPKEIEQKEVVETVAEKRIKKNFLTFLVLSLLCIGTIVSVLLLKQNQDLRQQADVNKPYNAVIGDVVPPDWLLSGTPTVTPSLTQSPTPAVTEVPYSPGLSSAYTSLNPEVGCDSGWYVCNVGCCGVGGTGNEGKRYSPILSPDVNNKIVWNSNDDISKALTVDGRSLQEAVDLELAYRGLKVDDNGVLVNIPPVPMPELNPEPTETPTPTVAATGTPTYTPTPTATPTTHPLAGVPVITLCIDGLFVDGECYDYWETLPDGLMMVVPASASNYSHTALIPVEKAERLQLRAATANANLGSPQITVTPTEIVLTIPPTNTPTATPTLNVSSDACEEPFVWRSGACVPDQTSSFWDSKWVNKSGCGAMQTLNYALAKDPDIDPNEFLEEYYAEFLEDPDLGYTSNGKNVTVLNALGYTVEGYTNNLIYHAEEEINYGGSFFVKGVFSGIKHYVSIDNAGVTEDNQIILGVKDSYFGIDYCLANGDDNLKCYDDSGSHVSNLDLSNPDTSIYLVLDQE